MSKEISKLVRPRKCHVQLVEMPSSMTDHVGSPKGNMRVQVKLWSRTCTSCLLAGPSRPPPPPPRGCEVDFSPTTSFLDAWRGTSELQMAFCLFVRDGLAILTNFLVYDNVSVKSRTYGFPVHLAKKYSSKIAYDKMSNILQ